MNVYVRTLEESTKIRDAGYIYLTYMKLLSAMSLRTLRSWNNQPIYVSPLHAEFVAGTIGFVGDKSQRDTRLGKLKWSPVSTLTESKRKNKINGLIHKTDRSRAMKRHIKVSTHTTHTCIYIFIYIYICLFWTEGSYGFTVSLAGQSLLLLEKFCAMCFSSL